MPDQAPDPEGLEAIVEAAEVFIDIAKLGLPDEHGRMGDMRRIMSAARRLVATLNPDRIPFLRRRFEPIEAIGWNDRVSSGLANLQKRFDQLVATWHWDDLHVGGGREFPSVIPHREAWASDFKDMERALALIRKGLKNTPKQKAWINASKGDVVAFIKGPNADRENMALVNAQVKKRRLEQREAEIPSGHQKFDFRFADTDEHEKFAEYMRLKGKVAPKKPR